jgi:predicted O-methyltransferase YrrM
VNALDQVAKTSLVWKRGLINPGGPHRVLAGTMLPISIGEDECAVFGRLIEQFRPQHAFIVGNAFGFSSCYIAEVMRQQGGQKVITLDCEVEGRGRDCATVARQLASNLELNLLVNKKGRSPADTAWAVEDNPQDLVFIDGDHSHPQVTRDFESILPFTHPQTIFVWHDFWWSGILPCLRVAQDHGLRWLWLPTSCEMVLGVRDEAVFENLQSMFPTGVENQQPHSPLFAPTMLAKEYIRQGWEAVTKPVLSRLETFKRTLSDQ